MIGLLVFVNIRMTNTSRAGRYGNLVSCPTYCVGFYRAVRSRTGIVHLTGDVP